MCSWICSLRTGLTFAISTKPGPRISVERDLSNTALRRNIVLPGMSCLRIGTLLFLRFWALFFFAGACESQLLHCCRSHGCYCLFLSFLCTNHGGPTITFIWP